MTSTTPKTRWQEITDIWQKEQWLYGLVGALAGFIFGVAASGSLGRIMVWFANGFWNEALSIAITVIVLDRLNRLRDRENYKQDLIRQTGSISNDFAVDAIERLRKANWLLGEQGVLKGTNLLEANLAKGRLYQANLQSANLDSANLQSANLMLANLQSANLIGANLKTANMKGVNLQSANLWGVEMQSANLVEANLKSANMEGVNLQSANLMLANLRDANIKAVKFDDKTVLPDANLICIVDSNLIFDKYWTPDTDMTRYTDSNHPDFWEPEWVKNQRDNVQA